MKFERIRDWEFSWWMIFRKSLIKYIYFKVNYWKFLDRYSHFRWEISCQNLMENLLVVPNLSMESIIVSNCLEIIMVMIMIMMLLQIPPIYVYFSVPNSFNDFKINVISWCWWNLKQQRTNRRLHFWNYIYVQSLVFLLCNCSVIPKYDEELVDNSQLIHEIFMWYFMIA